MSLVNLQLKSSYAYWSVGMSDILTEVTMDLHNKVDDNSFYLVVHQEVQ